MGMMAVPEEAECENMPLSAEKGQSRQSLRALDSLNFFLADVHAGVGPFLATCLLASLHLNPAKIGVAMSIKGIASLLAETPCGASGFQLCLFRVVGHHKLMLRFKIIGVLSGLR
jgi:hypothetical protein